MPRQINSLSDEQRVRMDAHAEHWIARGLATGTAGRAGLPEALRRCYELAGIAWHGNVIWVESPPVLALCAALADRCLPESRTQRIAAAAREAMGSAADSDPVAQVLEAVRQAGAGGPVREELERAVAYPVGEAITRAVDVTVSDAVERAVRSAVRSATVEAVDAMVSAAVGETISGVAAGPALGDRPAAFPRQVLRLLWGNAWYWGAAFTSFFREVCGLELPGDLGERALACEQAAAGAWWCYPHRDFALVCGQPREVHLEETRFVDVRGRRGRRLHHLTGPAVVWPDGWGVHAIHGVRVPARLIEAPATITLRDIEETRNAEVRRVLLDRYGWTRYMQDAGAEIVDELPLDHPVVGLRGARLLSKTLPGELEPVVYLEMVNSSAEPDGSHRRYLERIDPKVYDGDAGRLCHAAMASRWQYRDGSGQLQLTFADWRDYQPLVES